MLFDIIPVITVIIFIIAGHRKGFAAALVGAVKWIAALLVATCLAGGIAGFVYDSFMAQRTEETVAETVRANDDSIDLVTRLGDMLKTMDISAVDETIFESELFLESLNGGEEQIIEYVCNDIVRPLQISIIKPICFMVLFGVTIFALSLVERLLGIINKVPVIGGANRLFGALLGAVEGAVIACIVCCVLALLAYNFNIPVLTPENLESSFIVRPVAEALVQIGKSPIDAGVAEAMIPKP